MNKFLNLHAHSCHSVFDGIAKPLDYAKYISENPDKFYQALSISDHGTLNGMLETFLAAKKYNLKYIPSCEIYMTPTPEDISGVRYHLVLFGINELGMNQLVRINNEAIKRNQIVKSRTRRQYTIVTPDIMREVIGRDKGNLRCSGACIGGYFNHEILNDRMNIAEDRVEELINIFGVTNVYGEYQTFYDDTEMQKKVNMGVKQLAEKYKIKTIIASDAHALKKEDLQYSTTVRAMSMKMTLNDYTNKFGNDIIDSIYYKCADDFEEDLTKHDFGITQEDLEQSIDTTKMIFKAIQSFELHKEQTFIFGDGNKKKNNKLFLQYLSEGWAAKIKDKIPITDQGKYKDRLKHEVGILMQKGFVDYFLAVRRIVLEAESQGVVRGVGRGSAAGSLVSYLMDITNVDPLRHNLLFDRFINVKRMDFPDIDVDLSDRKTVIKIIQDLHPEKEVIVVSSKGRLQLKNSLQYLCKVLNVAYPKKYYVDNGLFFSKLIVKHEIGNAEIDKFMKLKEAVKLSMWILTEYGLDLEKMLKILVGNISSTGVHAGGVCILEKNQGIVPYTPIANNDYPYGSGLSESGGNTELEYVGEIKFDFLGIKTLRIFKDMIGNLAKWDKEKMKELNHKLIRFNDIDINDPLVYKFLEQGLTEGVFQFGSSGMRRMLKMLKPKNIEDLSALNALYRPGPLGSGMHKEIAKSKETKSYGVSLWDKEILKYVEDIIKVTDYQILYEEQTMLIGKVIADYSDEDLNDFRKFLKKPKRDAKFFANQKRFYEAFMNNGEKKNIDGKALQSLWDKLVEFSKYSFNKCLSEDTLVQTPNGMKEIRHINSGDKVLSYDIDSDNVIETIVKELHRNGRKKIYSIMTDSENEVRCTLSHKFLTIDNEMKSLEYILDNDLEIKNLKNSNVLYMKFAKDTLKEIGYRNTYDLEISHKDHNFLIGKDLIVTSNSHSMSYAYNSFLCAYFATYYPLEWYATLLKHEDPIEFIPVIKEHIEKRGLDIKLIPPKLNVSRNYPIPVEEDNTIILGTSLIKGVGPKASVELGRVNKVGKDYFTLEEFLNSPDIDHRRINKGVVGKLILTGYFDDFDVDRMDLLLELEKSKLSKKKLLEWDENKDENDKKCMTGKYGIIRNKQMFLYKKELEYLGTAIMKHPIKDELPGIIELLREELPFNQRQDAIPVVVNNIEQIRIKETKAGKKFLATSFRDIDGNLYWMNIWDNQIENLKNNDFDLEDPKNYNRTCVMLIADSNGWKNLLNFIAIE